MGPRRPRLLLPQAVDGAPQSALSAAALAAKTLQAGVTTMLTDNHAPQPAADGFKPPAPRTQPHPAPTQRNEQADSPSGSAGDNVLASLLGYGHDDAAGSPTSPAATAGSHAVRAVSCAPAGSTPGGAPPQPSGSSMDAELASFLSELESSGLLADDEDGKGGEPQLPASDSGIAAAAGEAADAAAAAGEAADAAAAAEQTAAAGEAAAGGASQSGTQAGSGGGGGGASAEQKVLGPVELEGAAHPWFLVLDTGTAKQYYWQPDTNDVAWTLPPTAVVPAATAAAAAAAVATAQAGETAPAAAAAAAAAAAVARNGSSDAQQQASSGAADTAVAAAAAAGPDSAAGPHVETATLPAAFLATPRPAALEAAERIAAECTEAAGPLLDQMPRVARLAVEAQALSALLLLLARAQEAAVGAADVAAAVKWTDLEATLCMALSALEAQLHALPGRTPLQGQSAAAGAAQAGTGGVGSAADGTEAAGAVLEAGSRSDSGEEEGELHSSLRQPQVQQQQAQPQPQPDADLPPPLPADCEQSEAAAGVGPPFPPPDAVHTQRGALETHAAPLPHSPPASLPPLPDEQPKKRRGPAAPSGVGKKARSGAGGAAPVAAAAALAGGSGAGHSKMGRSAASLINKWQKVAEEVAAQEEEEAAEEERLDDPLARAAASSAQRRRGAEEWRMQQLRSGAADGNSNFQPVLGDWRHRVQQQAEPQAAQAPVETAATAAEEAAEGEEGGAGDGAGGMPDLDLLSAGLPPGWQAMWDDTHAKVYYGNLDTSATQWERPA